MFTTNNDIQKILNTAKEHLESAKILKEDEAPDEAISKFVTKVYKEIDELLESAPYFKETQIEDTLEREKFENRIEFDIEYLSKYIEAIEKDMD